MRVHLYGNVLNWAYQFGKHLRERGHKVRVFIDQSEAMSLYRPEWEDDSAGALPDWVEPVDIRLTRLLVPGGAEREFLRRLGDCDVIQTFGEYALWAWRTRTPYVVLSYGGDLEILPFARSSLRALVLSRLIGRAFRGAAVFVYALPYHRSLVERLRLRTAVFNSHAVPIDTRKYAPFPAAERARLRSAYPHRFVFFHGARQEWTFKDANDKGNDRLFRAYARFVRDVSRDTLLIAVERGRDLARSRELVADLGLADRVRWVPALRKPALIAMLNSVDLFFDQFAHGYYGVVALEALACGVPTFVYIKRGATEGLDLPPVADGGSDEEIFQGMMELTDPVRRAAVARASREWVLAHHSWDRLADWYTALYQRAVEGR